MVEQSARLSSVGITAQYVGKMQQDPAARAQVLAGKVNLVFISHESIICNPRYRNMLLTAKYKEKLIAIVVDEAHCIKTWYVVYSPLTECSACTGGNIFAKLLVLWEC